MFGRMEIWSENNFHSHKLKKNTHENLSKQIHLTGYYIGDIHTIHAKAERLH